MKGWKWAEAVKIKKTSNKTNWNIFLLQRRNAISVNFSDKMAKEQVNKQGHFINKKFFLFKSEYQDWQRVNFMFLRNELKIFSKKDWHRGIRLLKSNGTWISFKVFLFCFFSHLFFFFAERKEKGVDWKWLYVCCCCWYRGTRNKGNAGWF